MHDEVNPCVTSETLGICKLALNMPNIEDDLPQCLQSQWTLSSFFTEPKLASQNIYMGNRRTFAFFTGEAGHTIDVATNCEKRE
jgi:hypothetical protein